MQVELLFFVSTLFTILILFIFLLEFLEERKSSVIKKDISLRKKKCEVCAYVYFASQSLKFWRCPFCASINK